MVEINKVTDYNFKSDVLEASQPVLVDFTAGWCGPCKMLDPLVRQLADQWEGKLKVMKLDVDEHPSLATQFQVMGIPTLILFKNGQPVERITGYKPKDRLEKTFQPHL